MNKLSGERFNEDDEQMLTAIAEQSGIALSNAAQHADEHANSVLLGRLIDLWAPTVPILTTATHELVRKLMAELQELVGADEWSVALCNTPGQPARGHTIYTEKCVWGASE